MAEASFANTRINPRFSFSADAEVTGRDGTLTLGRLSQLSARGCYIDTLQPMPVGTELHLHISDGMSSCELSGKVLYINPRAGVGIFGIGVLFGDMTIDNHAAIDRWLRELAGRRIQRRPVPDSDWQWGQVHYEINRLKGILLDPNSTIEERLIAQSQLESYQQDSEPGKPPKDPKRITKPD